ncbi:ABC-type transporter, periplasmic subunit family 3 [Desulfotomaculum nigrificans CO-1-SRB]|uniref:ABC-type transporter, periplasmic subunit family 3 n=1 Tax=Desulfotomaculum nigrificans (strain DSM 14880 / VKM B-2319 / CO-1-SRB) TaxID=868595 RepID=F6B379_DESCC|nr:basic amino acid ABC transporter substrate-binding protein [Desulfotomaculum nigrificans]AEF95110.1 ABC-type transporter, periplasmic subunit family 3 [Desulfotomaculum nigrificans CO-1-SRB]
MKKILKYGLLGLLVVALTVALVGCGGNKPAQETAKEQPKDAAKPKLVVGSDAAFAPFEFVENGKPTGFDVDLITALCEEAGYELDFRNMNFDGLIPALQTGQIDAAVSGMSINEERKQVVNFTDPYYKSGLIVAVQAKNNDIKGFDDLKGKKIAVQSGTTGAKMAEKVTTKDKIVYFSNSDQVLLDLKNGSVDAVINDYPVLKYFMDKVAKNDVKLVGEKLTSEDYGIAVPKNKTEVLEKLNAALKKIKENGKYAEIYKKWFNEEPPKE